MFFYCFVLNTLQPVYMYSLSSICTFKHLQYKYMYLYDVSCVLLTQQLE